MNQNDAVEKMRDLESAINTAGKYNNAREKFPTLLLMLLLSVVGANFIIIVTRIYDYSIAYSSINGFPSGPPGTSFSIGVPVVLFLATMGWLIYRMLYRAFRAVPERRWDADLQEGVTGIIKILEKEDWEQTLVGLKRAKQSFMILTTLQFIVAWAFTFIAVLLVYGVLVSALMGGSLNYYAIAGISALLVLGLGDRTITRRYRDLWYMDNLVEELRWFYLEFRGKEF